MKHMLNTLYVVTPGSYMALDGEAVAVKCDGQTTIRVPLHNLDGIVAFGSVGCSPALMFACADHNVSLSFMGMNGRFQARVQGPVSGNVLLRREQYRRADNLAESADIAANIIAAKIANCRTSLLRATRDHPDRRACPRLLEAAGALKDCLTRIGIGFPLDVLRGIEGEAAAAYFAVFSDLIVSQEQEFRFAGRSRRPPLDNVNALLSFVYSLVLHDTMSALEGVGLDPAVGFMHRDRPGRPGLALDLMEEVRPVLADRLVITLINRQQVRASGFTLIESGGVLLDETTRKTVLTAYQERKRTEMQHPFLKEKIPVGLLLHVQALLLARYLRGDMDAYPSFFWK